MQPIHSECVFVQERSDAASVCPRPVSGSLIEATQQSLARVRFDLESSVVRRFNFSHESRVRRYADIC